MKSEENKFKPQEIETKWQKYWIENRIYQPDLSSAKKPYYNLMMFPYPSAEGLHVGNMYAFTGADINGRYKRMQGFDVFEPIGLDGFGIHSENYAIKIGKHPAEQAKISQENFYRQLHAIGNGFAWENKLETYDPDYYKWTQWIFVQMFKAGLSYRKKSPVNFCPSCKTVLSDEQVIDGRCERCKSAVEKKDMEQWYFKITKYADKLLKNLETLAWTNKVKIGQRNWIGKKEGIHITYPIVAGPAARASQGDASSRSSSIRFPYGLASLGNPSLASPTIVDHVTVFTTAPVNFGMTFLVLAPEHEMTKKIISGDVRVPEKNKAEVEKYVNAVKKKKDIERIAEGKEKTGVFTGLYGINGINGKKVPVWVSDFVLGHVGTGAVQGCPGHDINDFQFAKKFGLPIIRVIVGQNGDMTEIDREEQVIEKGAKGKFVNSDFLNGLDFAEGLQKTMDFFEEEGWGKRVIEYKLRDWCISRQRYWGAPIPMIYCEKCKWQPVPEKDLPVLLPPDVKDWKPEGTGKGPLAKIESFVKVKCPNCKNDAKRETDVCDTFLDSSWYHLRYPSGGINHTSDLTTGDAREGSQTKMYLPRRQAGRSMGYLSGRTRKLESLPWDPEITKKWLPVTQYIGGAEHTVLHLLYARFVAMVFKDLGKINFEEPYTRFYAHGLIIAEGAKMSKSRGNVVVPDAYIAKYGADTLRTYLMFLGPFDGGGDFRDTGIAGMYRFLCRVWRLASDVIDKKNNQRSSINNERLSRFMHRTIKEVTEDMENFRYNTAIAHIMSYVNELTINNQQLTINNIKVLLLLLAPFAPHMTEELYTPFKKDNSVSIHQAPWPKYDPKYLVEDVVTIIIQVNGKIRDTLKVKSQNAKVKSDVESEARKSEKIKSYLDGKNIKNVVFIPGKLINFVL